MCVCFSEYSPEFCAQSKYGLKDPWYRECVYFWTKEKLSQVTAL